MCRHVLSCKQYQVPLSGVHTNHYHRTWLQCMSTTFLLYDYRYGISYIYSNGYQYWVLRKHAAVCSPPPLSNNSCIHDSNFILGHIFSSSIAYCLACSKLQIHVYNIYRKNRIGNHISKKSTFSIFT